MRALELLRASLRDDGLRSTLKDVSTLLLYTLMPRLAWLRVSRDGFDRAHGTDTAEILWGRELGPNVNRGGGGHVVNCYETTPVTAIATPLDQLAIDVSDFVFIDLGCGKGKPLMVAAGYPFQRLIGVDISQACITIARRNVEVHGPERIDPSRVELQAIDVEDYVFPDDPMVIYLFNPFPAKLMARVMANLEHSLQESPWNAVIVYVNPEAIEAVERSELFVRVPTTADWAPRREWAAVFATRPADWAWPQPPWVPRAV